MKNKAAQFSSNYRDRRNSPSPNLLADGSVSRQLSVSSCGARSGDGSIERPLHRAHERRVVSFCGMDGFVPEQELNRPKLFAIVEPRHRERIPKTVGMAALDSCMPENGPHGFLHVADSGRKPRCSPPEKINR